MPPSMGLDGDLPRLRFWCLRERDRQHPVLDRRLRLLGVYFARQGEAAGKTEATALLPMSGVPFWRRHLSCPGDRKTALVERDVDVLLREPGHVGFQHQIRTFIIQVDPRPCGRCVSAAVRRTPGPFRVDVLPDAINPTPKLIEQRKVAARITKTRKHSVPP